MHLQIDYVGNGAEDTPDGEQWRCDAHEVPRVGDVIVRCDTDGHWLSTWEVTAVQRHQRTTRDGWNVTSAIVVEVELRDRNGG